MRPKNYYVYGESEYLKRLQDEYEYIGREVKIEGDRLTVFALPQRKRKKNDDDRTPDKKR